MTARRKDTAGPSRERRHAELKAMLEQRQAHLAGEMKGRMHAVRSADHGPRRPREAEAAEGDDEDIDLALIQLKGEMLARITTALQRLERGTYGDCSACGSAIAASRLAALPFATRCLECERAREVASEDRLIEQRRLRPASRLFE